MSLRIPRTISINERAYKKLKNNFKPITNGENYLVIERFLNKNWKQDNNGFYYLVVENKGTNINQLKKVSNVLLRRSMKSKIPLNVIHYRNLSKYLYNFWKPGQNNINYNRAVTNNIRARTPSPSRNRTKRARRNR